MEITKIMTATMNDIIFDGRNKSYGAYELRQNYEKRALKALIVSYLVVASAILTYHFSSYFKNQNKEETPIRDCCLGCLELKFEETPKNIPPPAKKAAPLPPKPTLSYRPPNVVEDARVSHEDTPPAQENITGEISNKTVTETSDNGIPTPDDGDAPKLVPETEAEVDEIFISQGIEQPAEFPGGVTELMKWLSKEIRYPEAVRDIDGRVVLRFVVEKDGSISNINVLKSTHSSFENEAIRAIKKMPTWKAGRQNSRNVRCYFTLPVSFKLD
jgi:periplasmic protein TonB